MVYKVKYKDKSYKVIADSEKEAAKKIFNKLADDAFSQLEEIPLEARRAIRNNPGNAKALKAFYVNKIYKIIHSEGEPIKGRLLEMGEKIAKDLQGFIDFKDEDIDEDISTSVTDSNWMLNVNGKTIKTYYGLSAQEAKENAQNEISIMYAKGNYNFGQGAELVEEGTGRKVKVSDRCLNDYFDIKPGAVFRERGNVGFNDRFSIKIMKVTPEEVVYQTYDHVTNSGEVNRMPFDKFKALIDRRYKQVNSFYDSNKLEKLKDSNLSQAYAELKKFYPNAEATMLSKNGVSVLIVKNVSSLGSGIKSFLTNLNKKYGRPGAYSIDKSKFEPTFTGTEAVLHMSDSNKSIKDAKQRVKKGLAEFTINDTHKAYALDAIKGYNEGWDEEGLRLHAKMAQESADFIRELKSKGYVENHKLAYSHD